MFISAASITIFAGYILPILPSFSPPAREGLGVGQNGPCPMQLVVVSAVMAAVSIATSTSTALRLISAQAFSRRVSRIFMIRRQVMFVFEDNLDNLDNLDNFVKPGS